MQHDDSEYGDFINKDSSHSGGPFVIKVRALSEAVLMLELVVFHNKNHSGIVPVAHCANDGLILNQGGHSVA